MAKKQDAANTTGVSSATSKKGDNHPIVRRRPQGGGKTDSNLSGK